MLPGIQYQTDMSSSDVVSSLGVVTVGKLSLGSIATDSLSISSSDKGFLSQFAHEVSKHRCYERELQGITKKVAY
jgi:catalase